MSGEIREWRLKPPNIVLFGPPAVGKSSVGRKLAARLGRPFMDVDERVEAQAGKSVDTIFNQDGEEAFRRYERRECLRIARQAGRVVACGGGALLNDEVRHAVEATGTVICLRASADELERRLPGGPGRPLLAGAGQAGLRDLLRERQEVYDRFAIQVPTGGLDPDRVIERVAERVRRSEREKIPVQQGSGYSVHFERGLILRVDEAADRVGLDGPRVVVADENVAPNWGQSVADTLDAPLLTLPQGELAKRTEVIEGLYGRLLEAGLDRQGAVIAVGGGAALDAAGFAAATFMRGVSWVAVPTSLLAMVDASVGGKVGIDLPEGKNLVGAFHPPAAVWTDPQVLETLPADEWRRGMAEVVKAALIGDPELFSWVEQGFEGPTDRWLLRALKVKLAVVEADPLERGPRAKLNLGHTVGHALEAASGFRLAHGEAVAIGLVAEARIAAELEFAHPTLAKRIESALARWDLPVRFGDLGAGHVVATMSGDKKARQGKPRFVLPRKVGRVAYGLEVPPTVVRTVLEEMRQAS